MTDTHTSTVPTTRITLELQGFLGADPTFGLTARREREMQVWSEVATGEPRPPYGPGWKDLSGWEVRQWVDEPRDYARFSFCEHRTEPGTPSAQERGIRSATSKWWRAVCWIPEACPKLYSLKKGDKIEVRGWLNTWQHQGKTYSELVVISVRPVQFSRKRSVPAYDFVDGEVVASPYERGSSITCRCGRLDPLPRRPRSS